MKGKIDKDYQAALDEAGNTESLCTNSLEPLENGSMNAEGGGKKCIFF